MTLLYKEGNNPNIFSKIRSDYEQKKYAHLENPSIRNLFEIFDIIRKQHVDLNDIDEEGNQIEIDQMKFRHLITGMSQWETKGVRVSVRQKLPEQKVNGEKYLSIIMQRDEQEQISINTCVVEPSKSPEERHRYGKYIRIGDLRVDYLDKKTLFTPGIVDGNDDGFGIPTGEWHINGQNYDNALCRAYLLIAHKLFSVGQIPPLGSNDGTMGSLLLEG